MPNNSSLIILATFCCAFVLTVLPLPEWANPYRPQWVLLVLIYWCIALPRRVGVFTACLLGIVLDALTNSLLGQHALSMALIAFLALQLHNRIRIFPLWQQAGIILVLLTIEQLVNLLIMNATAKTQINAAYWFVPLIGALLWPWIFSTLRNVRRRFRVT